MLVKMLPVIDFDDLEELLYECAVIDIKYDLLGKLFGSEFCNDCYKRLKIKDTYDDEKLNEIMGVIQRFVPGHRSVLIKISW